MANDLSGVQSSTIINWLDICAAMLHYSKPKPGTSPCFLASTHLLALTNDVRAPAPCDSATLLRSPTEVVWRASLRSARPAVGGVQTHCYAKVYALSWRSAGCSHTEERDNICRVTAYARMRLYYGPYVLKSRIIVGMSILTFG